MLTRIEATLNSKPLCVLSSDPTNMEALTPSNFLTLEPSSSLPDQILEHVLISFLQHWLFMADIHSCF